MIKYSLNLSPVRLLTTALGIYFIYSVIPNWLIILGIVLILLDVKGDIEWKWIKEDENSTK